MGYICKVRTYLPLDDNGKPIISAFGYYDLEISSDGSSGSPALHFDEHTQVTNPVFCYGHNSYNQGKIIIFDASKTTNIFDPSRLIFKWEFSASNNQVNTFLTAMHNALQYSSGDADTGDCAHYNVVAGPFITYSLEHINCFYATAFMCNKLGKSTLLNIYNSNNGSDTGYLNYRAWTMFGANYTSWKAALLIR